MFPSDDACAQTPSPFEIQAEGSGFELMVQENGFKFWWASRLAELMGYKSLDGMQKAIGRAMATLTSLGIPIAENMVQVQRADGNYDWKLSRFACYLVAMNGDPKKPAVAEAQAYFVKWAEMARCYLEQTDEVERLGMRSEISDREVILSGVAKKAGVVNYAYFQNAGYRGLYNMDIWKLRRLKGAPEDRSPLDFMGKTELAANLFRVTQTEERIKTQGITGQARLEQTAEQVGKKVRQTMLELGGTRPEDLPPATDIKEVKKSLKSSHREIRKLDNGKKKKP